MTDQSKLERLQAIGDRVREMEPPATARDGYYRLNYPGNRVSQFDPQTGSGLIGRVMGMNHPWYGQRWFRVLDAEYDPETNKTTAELQRIMSPLMASELVGEL